MKSYEEKYFVKGAAPQDKERLTILLVSLPADSTTATCNKDRNFGR